MPKRHSRKNGRKMKEQVLQPMQIAIVPSINHTFRFTNASVVTRLSLTFQGLLDMMCVATSATAAYRLFGAIRLRRIRIWSAASSGTAPTTISFQKFSQSSGTGADSKLFTDTVLGTAATAFIEVKFNDSEAVGQWQGHASTLNYGSITLPQGSIVDVTFNAIMIEDNLSTSPVAGAVAAATTGQTYVRSLDSPTGGTQLTPLSYFTI